MFSNRKFKVIFTWLLVVIWMMLINRLSAQPASQSKELSSAVTETIVKTVEKVVPEFDFRLDTFNHLVRKNAHFFIYLVLAILIMNALSKSGGWRLRNFTLALGICILYAISDEIHQLVVPGRGGQVKDVFIDSLGSLFGIVIYLIVVRKKQRSQE
ncbi:VanZ family protein [Bacillus sp. OK048]|uniref:VanZ family protein n=1 Tax=Bacillus sp. OK048 TaxID=1882761 RepID=UPI00087E4B8F|nr:VanZ family protein [Bacillus sp. OK048]SDN57173.1 VanZ like family protein [Bacillus sp. OK048]